LESTRHLDLLHLKKCSSLGVWTLFPYFDILDRETKYRSTFTILAIIKLFLVNADLKKKLAVHNVESFKNYIKK
jgi:hypothetical protein